MSSVPSVVIYGRFLDWNHLDYDQRIPLDFPVTVDRYSHNMIGGPDKAYLTVPQHAGMWDLMKLLRCPVEIFGGDGRLNWWGYVNKVTIPHGEQRIGMGLDAMYNDVAVYYGSGTDATYDFSTEYESYTEFGTKAIRIWDSEATAAQAAQRVDLYLKEHKYPRPEIEFSGGSEQIQIECYGWYKVLDWQYYESTDTSNVENTTQISTITTTGAQYLLRASALIENTAGITSTKERDGRRTCKAYIEELLSAGTTNIRPLLAKMDRDRYLHVYERAAQPLVNENVRYLLRDDGNLVTALGQVIPPEHCQTSVWATVEGTPMSAISMDQMRPYFIESAEYRAKDDKCVYRPAGAYEQTRLKKFVEEELPAGSSDTVSSSDVSTMAYAMVGFTSTDGATPYCNVSAGITVANTSSSTGSVYLHSVIFTIQTAGSYIFGVGGAPDTSTDGSAQVNLFITSPNLGDWNYYSEYTNNNPAVSISRSDYLNASDTIALLSSIARTSEWMDHSEFWITKVA